MRFGEAIDKVTTKEATMTRACWNDEAYVGLQLPDGRSDMNTAFFYININMPELDEPIKSPWSPSIHDMIAHDWVVSE